MTASVQKGTKSTPGTSSARNAGRNSQCQPSRFTSTAATARSSTSSAGDKAPSANNGNTKIWSASAAMARIIAARKRERGESGIGCSVTAGAAFILPILTELHASCYHFAYQSECGDQPVQERHCVVVHWWRQTGHTPPVSNVFHSCPQLQDQRSSFWGDQPQSGHRMRGPDGPRLFSGSSSRSKTTDDLGGSS